MPEIVKNSVSQAENADKCLRRWWFQSCLYFPTPQSKAVIYGDVAHACADRFYLADDQGLDPKTGRPMDLFPPGWHRMKNRYDKSETMHEVNPVEQAQIKFLITSAIEKGILIREPGRVPEFEFWTHLEVSGFPNHIIQLHGYKDLVIPDGVMDHKFMKSPQWCKNLKTTSDKYLGRDIQMMTYGLDHHFRFPHLPEVLLGHNQFIKDRDKPSVRQLTFRKSPAELWDFYHSYTAPLFFDMMRIKLNYPKGTEDRWQEVRGAKEDKTCNFYFGKNPCPFLNICTGRCKANDYVRIFQLNESRKLSASVTPSQGETIMASGLMAAINQEEQLAAPPAAAGTVPPPAAPLPAPAAAPLPAPAVAPLPAPAAAPPPAAMPAPALAPAVAPPAVAPPAATTTAIPNAAAIAAAPWHSPGCTVCAATGLLGYAANGQPCRICQTLSGQAPAASTANADGSVTYETPAGATTSPALPAATVVTKEPAAPAAAPAAALAPAAAPVTAFPAAAPVLAPPATQPAPAPVASVEPSSVPGGFTLLMGCVMAVDRSNSRPTFDAQDIYTQTLARVQQETGKDVRTLDHFKALEMVDTMIPLVVPGLGGSIVIAHTGTKGSLYHRFAEGLRAAASMVIVACAE